jgi:hypothetical protein
LYGSLGLDPAPSSATLVATQSWLEIAGHREIVDPRCCVHGPQWLDWLRSHPWDHDRPARLQEVFVAAGAASGGPSWDRVAGLLCFPQQSLRAHLLGSFSPSERSWCWAWANRSLAEVELGGIEGVRQAATLPMLRHPGFDCTEPFAFLVAHTACAHLDPALGVWRWPLAQGPQLFFGVALP